MNITKILFLICCIFFSCNACDVPIENAGEQAMIKSLRSHIVKKYHYKLIK